MRLDYWISMGCVALSLQAKVYSHSDLDGWEAIDLVHYEIADTNVYMERGLEPLLPTIKACLAPEVSSQQWWYDPNLVDQILATINGCLGISDANQDEQRAMIKAFSPVLDVPVNPLYLVRQTTTKAILRSGKEIPGFSYDPNTDSACALNNFRSQSGHQTQEMSLTIPLPEDDQETVCKEFLMGVKHLKTSPDTAIHEVAEITLVRTAQPIGPYTRWFNEGTANVITYHVLARHLGNAEAEEFLKGYDPTQYASLEKQINLRYWPILNYTLLGYNPPLESLKDLNLARYSYATWEVKRLVDSHGIAVLTMIIQDYLQQSKRNSETLFATILKHTGEDLDERFNRYQDFSTLRDGQKKYVLAFQQAKLQKDALGSLLNLQYFDELKLAEHNNGEALLDHRVQASILLMFLRYSDYGVDMMERCIDFAGTHGGDQGREAALDHCLQAALSNRWNDEAEELADRQIKKHPQIATPARATKMIIAIDKEKDLVQAQYWAAMIVNEIADHEDPVYKEAQRILAMEPNDVN